MMYYRRKLILSIFEVFGGSLTAKQFQKYLFLITKRQEVRSFDFMPYYYGCFSFQANYDMSVLMKMRYLEIIDSPAGRRINLIRQSNCLSELTAPDIRAVTQVKLEFGRMSQRELIRYTYIRYPYYAIKSKISCDILTPKELMIVDKQRKEFDNKTLFTIGYEGRSIDAYMNSLINNGVRVLCDVRKNAISQKYGFSRNHLEKACAAVGIRYLHFPELGIESDLRRELHEQQDYDALFDAYRRTTLIDNWNSILKLRSIIDNEGRIALTCFEKNPQLCHRSIIAAALMNLPDKKYDMMAL